MPKGPFLPSDFIPTKFSTAAEKADFGNALLHFIESEWGAALFTKSLYNRLSMCFGHIAHHNRSGFYETWFTCDGDRLRFLAPYARLAMLGGPGVHILRRGAGYPKRDPEAKPSRSL